MSDIYIALPKDGSGLKITLPAHTTWQGASQELSPLPAWMQDKLEVYNFELIDDEE